MDKKREDLLEVRLEKLNNFKKKNINPYPSTAERTISCKKAVLGFEKLHDREIYLVGRISSVRSQGGLTFADIEDGTGKVQLFLRKNTLGKDLYKFFNNFDLGDFIQAKGKLFKTKSGEITLEVVDYKILSKSLKSLPEKWHGLKDVEERLRKRYLDILLNPDLKERFKKKSVFWQSMREFLISKDFNEVETPVLEVMPGGADAKPFITHHNALDIDLYLRISMGELWQKRLMVAGFEKTFEIGRQFRNEGIDPEHLQDYTQMEFYIAYANYEDGMNLVEEMYKNVIEKTFGTLKFRIKNFNIDFNSKWERIDFTETIKNKLTIDVLKASDDELKKKCQELKLDVEEKIGRGRLIDTLWKQVRKSISGPAFLINHPVEVSPLAKRKEKDQNLVERFQVIIAGSEIGNGYSELNDPQDQAKRFEEQAKLREFGDEEAQMHDKDFIEALEYGMPPTCGFGVSERLFSFLTGKPIRECVLFPLLRPKEKVTDVVRNEKAGNIKFNISRDDSFNLLKKRIKEDTNIFHSLETEAIMRALAKKLGENKELWGACGLLHDLDWEETGEEKPNLHGLEAEKILLEANYPEELIQAIKVHNYAYNKSFEPVTKLDYALRAGESITGLIYAAVLVRPDKKLESVKVKSIKKKIKDKSFAANVNRDMIKECKNLGLGLDEFIEISLDAMKEISKEIGL